MIEEDDDFPFELADLDPDYLDALLAVDEAILQLDDQEREIAEEVVRLLAESGDDADKEIAQMRSGTHRGRLGELHKQRPDTVENTARMIEELGTGRRLAITGK